MSGGARRQKVDAKVARPPRPELSRERIAATALKIIDDEGLDALSMRHLGATLGVDSMAIYYYLPSKAALFDAVVKLIYADLSAEDIDPSLPWREQMALFMHRFRQVLRRHPNALPVVATRPVSDPDVYVSMERGLTVLAEAGFMPALGMNMISCLSLFTIGHALAEVGVPVGGESPTGVPAGEDIVARFPRTVEALSAGYHPDEQYELGLQAMLEGLDRNRPTAP